MDDGKAKKKKRLSRTHSLSPMQAGWMDAGVCLCLSVSLSPREEGSEIGVGWLFLLWGWWAGRIETVTAVLITNTWWRCSAVQPVNCPLWAVGSVWCPYRVSWGLGGAPGFSSLRHAYISSTCTCTGYRPNSGRDGLRSGRETKPLERQAVGADSCVVCMDFARPVHFMYVCILMHESCYLGGKPSVYHVRLPSCG